MKIAYLSVFYPYRGGIAQFNANLFQALDKTHRVKAYNFKRQYPSLFFPGKTQHVSEQDPAVSVSSEPVLDSINPISYRITAKHIIKEEPDLLLMRYWMPFFAPSLGSVARSVRKRGTTIISIIDNLIPHERTLLDNPLSRWFLDQNDGCVAMSTSVRNDILALRPGIPLILRNHPLYDHFGALQKPEEARYRLGLEPDRRTLLFFGFIRDYKGLDLLLEAFRDLGDTYQLVIAGECYGSFEKYEKMIRLLPNPPAVKVFNRYIADSEVPLFFSAADVCVLPYRTATQSGISAMAYHFQVPVIVTPAGGLAEAVEGPGTGLVASGTDACSLVQAIRKFFTMDREFFKANINREKAILTWDRFAFDLTDFAGRLKSQKLSK
ncbi:MAG: glycosyltransferase [Bacteroidales bacterium]|jgi:glycosyltransferase involved in cell wall biosynthesis|nr:glycosyltransferase [Bacteroidales bacterium]MDD2265103.1 glycosyltransferase [Bacteroidales bacterium]MDD2832267.1 glycosyltransferase [Bacteroidales bacterium]MDD3209512.1 glycosyltransferase [Bacteroidales bacterium]MDD3698062.1 glycosyltransferase [Bacteroidales bacterium]